MADQSDVEIALVRQLNTLFGQGAAFWSGQAANARVFRGTPKQFSTSTDRSRSTIDIAVRSQSAPVDTTTRWLDAQFSVAAPPGILVQMAGQVANFVGTANADDLIGCLAAGKAFSYVAKGGETAALIAATMCQLIRQRVPCALKGSTITVPPGQPLQALSF